LQQNIQDEEQEVGRLRLTKKNLVGQHETISPGAKKALYGTA